MNEKISKYIMDWFSRGDDDLVLVKLILEKGTGSPNLACFHAQQAAEKYLKGFLAYHDLHVRRIHDLEILVEDGKKVEQLVAGLQDDARFLNQFYIESRYPDDYIELLCEDAGKALTAAIRIKEFVLSKVSPRGKTDGFGLVGILIAVATITAFVGGELYLRELKQQKFLQQMGREAEKRAEDVKAKIKAQQKDLQQQMNNGATSGKMSTVDTSNWKIYRNEKYGFEVRYPANLKSWDNTNSIIIAFRLDAPQLNFAVRFDQVVNLSLNEFVEKSIGKNLPRGIWIKIDFHGVPAIQAQQQIFGPETMSAYFEYLAFVKDGIGYIITMSGVNKFTTEERRSLESILSTFKFLK